MIIVGKTACLIYNLGMDTNCKTIKETLSEYDFIQIHQSFYVNMNSIRKIKNDHY